jgi:nicotinate-nucleotide--dimethylbenzimidazole phosphoribosyltransferase
MMDYDSFLELARRRRSHWEFRPDPVPGEYIEKVVDAARYAPSGFNSQPWEFVVVQEQELRDSIVRIVARHMPRRSPRPGGPPLSRPGPMRKDPMGFRSAPVFILLCGDPRVRRYGPPGMLHDDKRWQFTFTSTLAIAYQYMHLAAASLGLGSRWVSAVSSAAVEAEIKELLGIPEPLVVYDLMALGFSDFQPPSKKLRTLSQVLHFGRCSQQDFRTDEEVEAYFRR